MKYSGLYRIWHWLNAAMILGLVGTVLLRKGFLSHRVNSEIIMGKLSTLGTIISKSDATMIAKSIRDIMWEWHIILGFGLLFVFIFWIVILALKKGKNEDFKSLSLYKKLVEISHYLLHISIFLVVVTGFILHFKESLSFDRETLGMVKDLHKLTYKYFQIFIVLHILGVIFAEFREEEGIVSKMIGGKNLKEVK